MDSVFSGLPMHVIIDCCPMSTEQGFVHSSCMWGSATPGCSELILALSHFATWVRTSLQN